MSNGDSRTFAEQQTPAQQSLAIEPAPQAYSVQPDPPAAIAQAPPPPAADPNAELTELRELRDKVGPMAKMVNELGGDVLMQHYTNYSQMVRDQQQPQAQPQQPRQDEWGNRLDTQPYYDDTQRADPEITQLRDELVQLKATMGQMTHSTGLDKIEAHSKRFFADEWPDLTADEQKQVSDGMKSQFDYYATTDQGRKFLANPQYAAIRALALNCLPPETMETALRRKIARESQGRQAMRTDAPTPSTGQEGMDLGTDAQTAWDRSLEAIQRETL